MDSNAFRKRRHLISRCFGGTRGVHVIDRDAYGFGDIRSELGDFLEIISHDVRKQNAVGQSMGNAAKRPAPSG